MLAKVLVGIDGSSTSEHVLEWCMRAFSGVGTEVLVVVCREDRSALGHATNEELRLAHDPIVDDACARLRAAGVSCSGRVVDGDARVALIEAAREHHADLIVVGSRGRSPLTDLMLGSVANYLTHRSPFPVTVVR